MAQANFSVQLQWLAFPVNLQTVEAWIYANEPAGFCGQSADQNKLTLHFTAQPSDDQVAAIQLYWEALTPSSTEATEYQTLAQQQAAAASAQASALTTATAKLTALGLTQQEIAALRG